MALQVLLETVTLQRTRTVKQRSKQALRAVQRPPGKAAIPQERQLQMVMHSPSARQTVTRQLVAPLRLLAARQRASSPVAMLSRMGKPQEQCSHSEARLHYYLASPHV